MRLKLGIAGLLLALLAAWFTVSSQWGGSATSALTEALLRRELESQFAGAEFGWREIALSRDPPSITLAGVRVRWSSEPGVALRAERVVMLPDPRLVERGTLALASARFEGLRVELVELVELPGSLPADSPLALRTLKIQRVTAGAVADSVASGTRTARELLVSGNGELVAGGSLRFEVHREVRRGVTITADFAEVPAAEWAALAPELRDASGTISGRIAIELGLVDSTSVVAGTPSPAAGPVSIEGSFEIDATRVGLSVADAYRKPVGKPATLTGRFRRSPQGEFEFSHAHLSIGSTAKAAEIARPTSRTARE